MTVPEVRAITVRPPWAQAIAVGAKPIENRGARFPRRYRGPVLIHAGSSWSARGAVDDRVARTLGFEDRHRATSVRSAILAVADLVDVHPASPACCEPGGGCHPWGETSYREAGGREIREVSHLVLDDTRSLARRVPWQAGRLGLWTPPADLVAEVSDVLGTEVLLAHRCEVCGCPLVRRSGRLDDRNGDGCSSPVCDAPA